jgi:hypothetical protein
VKIQAIAERIHREVDAYLKAHPKATREELAGEVTSVLDQIRKDIPVEVPDVTVTADPDDPTLVHVTFQVPSWMMPRVTGQEN